MAKKNSQQTEIQEDNGFFGEENDDDFSQLDLEDTPIAEPETPVLPENRVEVVPVTMAPVVKPEFPADGWFSVSVDAPDGELWVSADEEHKTVTKAIKHKTRRFKNGRWNIVDTITGVSDMGVKYVIPWIVKFWRKDAPSGDGKNV